MVEKTRFVLAVEAEESPFAELCEAFGIARETGYRWWRRYRDDGLGGLAERSRRPKRTPSATVPEVVELLLQARQRKPTRGAAKLLNRLRKKHPELAWPSDTTGHRILKRHGLVQENARRSRAWREFPGTGGPFAPANAPNVVWTVDFKGQFRLGNRQWCYPLTIQDLYSRYGLQCRALASTAIQPTQKGFVDTFRAYGLPERIRSDNGPPFASRGLLGLSQLSIWFLKLGIQLERIAPGQPQQNGQHERYHRTLKAETTLPAETTMRAQQLRFDAFLRDYNQERPHESIHMAVPADYYHVSSRTLPRRNEWPGLDYPEGWQRRTVRPKGEITWRGGYVFVSVLLGGETIALQPISPSVSLVRFCSLTLGVMREGNTFVPA
jgi:transposase InsO family protein